MNNIKRVFKYVKGRYRLFFLSILMIILVQGLGFASPLIVKAILDDYIMGIEYEWNEVASNDEQAVFYDDHYYIQTRHLDNDDVILQKASIVLYKTSFYIVNDIVPPGQKSLTGNILQVERHDGEILTFEAVKLSASDVFSFYQPIIPILIILICILFLRSILVIIGTYIQHISTNRVVSLIARDARTAAMKSVERLPIKYFEAEPAGKMAARITHDVDGMIAMYRLSVNAVISTIFSFVLAYVGMFILDVKLALLTFIIYPLIYIWVRFFLKRLRKIAEKVNELRSLLTAKINEIINGINILQIFNFQKQTVKEFNQINEGFKNEQLKEVKLHITAGWNMIGIIRAIITTLIIAYFGWQYLSISDIVITAGLIYAYNEYLLKIIDPVNVIFVNVGEFQHSLVRIERISKLIEGELEDDTTGSIERYMGGVHFDNVWFAYSGDNYVLKGVNIDIKPGEMVGLVGHTGSGKSSLMNLLLRFYDITDEKSGKITIDGLDISKYPKRILREHLGIVLQEPTLFKGTIASNIRFGKKGISDEELVRILTSMGGKKILDKFPQGINHEITRSGVNLSSGEKQIITLARVVVHNPSILIMDEATSHIDTETEEMIKTALKVVCENRTVIVIAHRLSTIYNADKIIVLDHGLKVEEGTHAELVKCNGYYANMYRAQQANIQQSIAKQSIQVL
ncbi:MAG: ABC transporter ATP-binding protein [Bacilli bacterium]|nr:ABC transporter ATP-binding protein [Bacilli bacterium]